MKVSCYRPMRMSLPVVFVMLVDCIQKDLRRPRSLTPRDMRIKKYGCKTFAPVVPLLIPLNYLVAGRKVVGSC